MFSEPAYKLQGPLLNTNEHELFKLLKEEVGNQYLILPQVHLEKLIKPRDWKGKIKYAVGHISRRSVDFALFTPVDFIPYLAIELNGESHNYFKRQLRDKDVQKHLQEANLPLLTFTNQQLELDEGRETIRNTLRKYL